MDARTWALKYQVEDGGLAGVFSWSEVAFSPDGKRLALGGSQGTYCVQLWDVLTRQPFPVWSGQYGELKAMAFAPDGSALATAAADGTVLVWDLTHGGGATAPPLFLWPLGRWPPSLTPR